LATLTGMVMRTGGTKARSGSTGRGPGNIAASVEGAIDETAGEVTFSALSENAGKVLRSSMTCWRARLPPERIDPRQVAATRPDRPRKRRSEAIAGREFSNLVYGKDNPTVADRICHWLASSGKNLVAFHQRYFFRRTSWLACTAIFLRRI